MLVGNDLQSVFLKDNINKNHPFRQHHFLLVESDIPKDAIVIGCVARLLRLKGIDTLIKIAYKICQEYPQCYFFVKGDGPLKYELTKMVRNLNIQDKFIICDKWLEFEELPFLYKSFDIFILPTRRLSPRP